MAEHEEEEEQQAEEEETAFLSCCHLESYTSYPVLFSFSSQPLNFGNLVFNLATKRLYLQLAFKYKCVQIACAFEYFLVIL